MTLITLSRDAKDSYTRTLHSALQATSSLLTKGIIPLKEYGFCEKIANMARILATGEEISGRFRDVKLETQDMIGFPHFSTISDVLCEQSTAVDFLKSLPSREECIEQCLNEVHATNPNFESVQRLWQKREFFEQLHKGNLPELKGYKLVSTEEVDGYAHHTLLFQGYDLARLRFISYSIVVAQKGNSSLIRNEEITQKCQRVIQQKVGLSSAEMFTAVNQLSGGAVIEVGRVAVGPFLCNQFSYQDKNLAGLFPSESPLEVGPTQRYVLELEEQISEDSDTYLIANYSSALKKSYKQNFEPKVIYKRHFVCSDEETQQQLERVLLGERKILKFYIPKEEKDRKEE